MTEVQVAQRGKGMLRVFNEAGVLAAADVHVALRLSALGGESSEDVVLATALAVRAVRSGSVCLDLTRIREVTVDEESEVDLDALPWPDDGTVVEALRQSPLVTGGSAGPLRPLRLVDTAEGGLLYLDRYFRQEATIRRVLDQRAVGHPLVDEQSLQDGLDALFRDQHDHGAPAPAPDRQRIAAAVAATQWTSVVVGGPGTGKTHTVARVLALLTRQPGPGLRIALAAPTGKAAARLQESVREQSDALGLPPDLTAMTLHRLLGWQRGRGSRFRYNANNHLPYDAIVVDETSMVSLTMMCRLLEAVRPDTRLVLVGDPDQLTSVDAGAVLADLVARPVTGTENPVLARIVGGDLEAADDPLEAALSAGERDRLRGGVVRLSRGRRFGGGIAQLAVAVRKGEPDEVMEILSSGFPEVSFHGPEDLDALRADVVGTAAAVTGSAESGDALAALRHSEEHRLLCAHREGPYGVQRWARQAMEWIGEATGQRLNPDRWSPGQPLMVTANDHETKIYNGDTGVIVRRDDDELVAAFVRGNEPFLLHPTHLSAVQTVYAMTIHRSQGSQYDTVSVVLPGEASSLLTRELLYTAITRARKHVRIIGSEDAVRAGVQRRVLRASGLRRAIP
ncbi:MULTISPECIES: exodeoxyribonuclease V subunit alpha [Rhodococcus]|uniref:exodeoxyribonuclease V subunit alpha n=1 Tax=Rhodococcus TaxID=1827 RepID=UPI000EAA1B9F|nr:MULTISPECIES: exodeoxyribonuclease V subunit alpha [Rhodococcus]MDI9935558.1 exodeoxyribonuclease V subunit alpha [Rhodococcus sp. IEGM 1351]MDJ0412965.1 exodeoxyribonuclease V subunit alpha [Rhodococcus opacus]MDV6245470.1 exodeoxyribonuclease V subunit alpha [Rhodococcus opacus]QZS57980.1 exodeoxyribonuclease V subunit alpha [Rhodococcus opacus]RKM75410.1 exodeoxyribonuclease V subunit alpha [Rhodococcus opacus]